MRALPLVAALLLVTTAGATGAPAAVTPTDGPTEAASETTLPTAPVSDERSPQLRDQPRTLRTTNAAATNHTASNASLHVLTIPEDAVTRSSHRKHHVDLGPALGFETNATSARLRTLSIAERVRAARTADRRASEIESAFTALEGRTDALRERERTAVRAYGAGEITPRELLIRLAQIDLAARELDHRQSVLADLAEDTEGIEPDQRRLASLTRRIDTLTGPVRDRAVAVLQAEAPPSRFYVATGPDSVVLTTIEGGTYVREAFRGDRYTGGERNIDPERALDIAAESYPTIWELRQNNTDVTGSNGNYLVTVPHERGTLRAFVDGGSAAVYKEFQRRPLSSIDRSVASTTVKDGLRLTVNRSYPGGAVRVQLVDAETGDPVDANVTLGQRGSESELLGRTGADGVLWTLSPRGPYAITAIRGNAAVVLRLRPTAPDAAETTGG